MFDAADDDDDEEDDDDDDDDTSQTFITSHGLSKGNDDDGDAEAEAKDADQDLAKATDARQGVASLMWSAPAVPKIVHMYPG